MPLDACEKPWLILAVPRGPAKAAWNPTRPPSSLLQVMVKDGKLPFVFDRNRGTRFGLRRHDAPSTDEAVRWFNLPSRMIFHVVRPPNRGLCQRPETD